MSFKNTRNCYGSMAKALHWITFIFLCAMIGVGFYMDSLPKGPGKYELYNMHKLAGLSVLLFILFRLFWRYINVTPELPENVSMVERILSRLVHALLYLLALMMPITGLLMSSASNRMPHIGGWTLPTLPYIPQEDAFAGLNHSIHVYGVWVLIAFATLHILAALKHHFINRNNVLRRMIPYGNALD